MSEPNNAGEKTLSVSGTKTLSLKRPTEQGTVRQSFSHGRTKQVVVEKVKRRVLGPGEVAKEVPPPPPPAAPAAQAPQAPRPAPTAQVSSGGARPMLSAVEAAKRNAAVANPQAARPAPPPIVARAAPEPAVAPVSPAAPAPVVAPAPVAEAPVEPKFVAPAAVVEAAPPVAAPAAPVPAQASAAANPPAAPSPAAVAPSPTPAPIARTAAPAARPASPPAAMQTRSPQPGAARQGQGAGPQATRPAQGTRPQGRPPVATPATAPARPGQQRPQTGMVLRTLTDEERDARMKALAGAKTREEEDRRRAELDAKIRAEREALDKADREAAEARKREEDARRAQEAESKRKAEDEARRRLPQTEAAGQRRPLGVAATAGTEEAVRSTLTPRLRTLIPPRQVLPARPTRGGEKSRGRLTVATATSEQEDRTRSVAAFRRRTQRLTRGQTAEQKEKIAREIVLPETITIQELANRMSERAVDVIRLLMKSGQMVKINDVIDADTAELLAQELGHTVKRVAESDVEEGLFDEPDDEGNMEPRPPVVTIMGHVDHGKTSLLDAIRSASVVSGEAGGITQHIGAYQVISPSGAPITFIDTPGHAAFTAMRARGAKVTDIVVLVVAADDGVMPQTIEAIHHARAAKVPIIVAINKIDKSDAKPERVRSELLHYDVQVESMGGDTLEVEVSALKHTNLDRLLEAIDLQAEVLDLKADADRAAEGSVIEARLDRGRGPVATVLIQKGSLIVGDIVVAGSAWGRVRAMLDDQGEPVDMAGPSFPVEVLGFSNAPEAGDRVAVVESEARAREVTEYRERQKREKLAVRGGSVRGTLADMMSQIKSAGRKELALVLKGDVQGSVEAILATLDKLGNDEVAARVVHSGVGGVTESDVTLAMASNAVILGFNVRAHKEARASAEQTGVEIRYYNIIYNLVDDVKAAMSGMLPPTLREEMLGNALILEVFNISKVGKVAGCRVTDGNVQRGANVRLIRDSVVVHEGKLSTLKRFKDEVKEVLAGQECGMAFESYQDMRQGDIIECYRVHEEKRTL
ncbi:translation initiation factor IF-2 [Lichenifustis flavocetrariae]|uniref:Translation initiation factor IF-2 n=1 Tax=Lichenifustis flavocetrariae TaxID=2949735 RepID=A0AA41Z0F2_9HYPH|nr:translation initiation factor IF-2 [Lichenifustis flavocetrariae]MCW6510661.1 translation initiation factor IF-2 [Lichenifustis flavocetrariae]